MCLHLGPASPPQQAMRAATWPEAQNNDIKAVFVHVIEVLKEGISKPLKEIYENANSGEKRTSRSRHESGNTINKENPN